MAGTDNLIPIRDSETARELQKRSSQKQKENHQKRLLFKAEIEKQLGNRLEKVIKSMFDEAEKGNVQAITFLRDTIGEKPKDEVEQKQDINITMNSDLGSWGK